MTTPVLWCLLSAVLFGASTPFAKHLSADLGPFTLAGFLYLGAGLAVLPISLRGGSRQRRRHGAHIRYLVGAIFFGGILGPVLLLTGLRSTGAASVSLWLNLETVATAVLACFFFREHIGWRAWAAVVIAVAAGALLAGSPSGSFAAAMLIAAACLCWGLDNNFTALIDGFTPAQSTLVKGLVAGSINLLIGLAHEEHTATASTAVTALAVGAVCYGASIVLYIAGAQQLGASRSQILFATAPYVGVALSWTALGEPVELWQAGAAIGMVASIALLISGHHSHAHRHSALTHAHSHRHDDGHHGHGHVGLLPWVRHTHEHTHAAQTHSHDHVPDLHHRHQH